MPTGMEANGKLLPPSVPRTEAQMEATLTGDPIAIGYKPRLPIRSTWMGNGTEPPPYHMVLRDVAVMQSHPVVLMFLSYYCSGIWPARFNVKASSPEVEEFVQSQLKRWWQRALADVQWSSYSWGWVGGEICYKNERGRLVFDQLITFAPPDAHILTDCNKYVGIRVRSQRDMGTIPEHERMTVNLFGPEKGRPSKSWWSIHNRRYGGWHGWTQLYGAWKPWRELALPDGGEDLTNAGMYRYAFQGPEIGYPKGSERATRHPPGDERIDYRDIAKEMGEGLKAGASIAMPTEVYPDTNVPKWHVKWPDKVLNPDGLINYNEYLSKKIAFGIGVPFELLQAPERGGERTIPKEAFFLGQQHNAESQVHAVRIHWLDGLVEWNFGEAAWYEVEVLSLLESQMVQSQGFAAMPGAPAPAGTSTLPSQPSQDSQMGQDSQPGQPGGFDIDQLAGVQQMALENGEAMVAITYDQWLALTEDEDDSGGRVKGRHHAPKGGITIGGKFFRGGQIIPNEVFEKATPEQKKFLEQRAEQRQPATDEAEHVEPKPETLTKEEEAKTHTYASVIAKVIDADASDPRTLEFVHTLSEAINEGDLAEKGRETDPHITVLYGMGDGSLEQVKAVVKKFPPITCTLGRTKIFPDAGNGEVVYLEVKSDDLVKLNNHLSVIPHVRSHAEYKPHITLGYVKPGKGKEYDGAPLVEGDTLTIRTLTFSGSEGSEVEIELGQ